VNGVHRRASNVGTFGELGRLPLVFDGLPLSCDYFGRCESLPDSALVKKAFLDQKRLDLDWYHNIYQLKLTISHGTSKLISVNVFQNQRTNFINKLFDEVHLYPKLEYYRRVKTILMKKIITIALYSSTDPCSLSLG
jgi:hypothetical protein